MTKELERRHLREPVTLRASDGGARIGGYALKFNKLSRNLGGWVEQIAPESLRKSAGDGWPNVMARYNHEVLLGSIMGGSLRLAVDGTGLDYEVDLLDAGEGIHQPVPHACPDCGNPDLKPLGQGTQRVEAALTRVLPGARIRRIDRDTVSHRDAWAEVYQAIHDGEVDVLVGTQMLAKGHDFPTLSLVVALNTDGGLYSADFRASETLFSQLMHT